MFLLEKDIISFLSAKNIDIRKLGNGRWIDQKCTADVVCIVADCINHYVVDELNDISKEFSSQDIWFSKYTVDFVQEVFKKPVLSNATAKSEYDKFFMQPLELLACAGVLEKRKSNRTNMYRVCNQEMLLYIALRERNALVFLTHYIEKVLTDSGLIGEFDDFFAKQTSTAYQKVKEAFASFTKQYTPINGDTECNRIFIKVLNPLAYARNSKGTERGRLSENVITLDMLMYNRNNFRDIATGKAKSTTRKELNAQQPTTEQNNKYFKYQVRKAKEFLRAFVQDVYNGVTEHRESSHLNDKATHIHHIFPEAYYPEIAHFLENLIALTPTQHLNYAHPNGDTRKVDIDYQYLLLMSKVMRIQENIEDPAPYDQEIYQLDNLVYVISVGFDKPRLVDELDQCMWSDVVREINIYYGKAGDQKPEVV